MTSPYVDLLMPTVRGGQEQYCASSPGVPGRPPIPGGPFCPGAPGIPGVPCGPASPKYLSMLKTPSIYFTFCFFISNAKQKQTVLSPLT